MHHSGISFSVRHLGISKVRGRFNEFDAWLDVGTSLEDTRVEATIYMSSVDTNQPDRDEHLRSEGFFDVASHPQMRFVSNRITGDGDDWRMEGELTVMGKTQPFGFDVDYEGLQELPAEMTEAQGLGPTRHAGFAVTGQLKRSEHGLDFAIPASAGVVLGDVVRFELDLQFVEPSA